MQLKYTIGTPSGPKVVGILRSYCSPLATACSSHVVHVHVHTYIDDDGLKLDLYLPAATWYDWYTHKTMTYSGRIHITVDTPLDTIPVRYHTISLAFNAGLIIARDPNTLLWII